MLGVHLVPVRMHTTRMWRHVPIMGRKGSGTETPTSPLWPEGESRDVRHLISGILGPLRSGIGVGVGTSEGMGSGGLQGCEQYGEGDGEALH